VAKHNLGPLPQGDRNDELQRLSLAALQRLFPPERFIMRDERTEDKGVDGSIEMKVGRAVTNLRAQYQIKSQEASRLNTDGSISYPVAVKNLNYLLNGPSGLYFLWSVERQEMRYAWARDELRTIEDSSPAWRSQAEVTIRFRSVVDAAGLDDIHARVLAEGRLHRATTERLALAVDAEPVALHIDPATLDVANPDEVFRIVAESGLGLVARGGATRVCELAEQIAPRRRQEPKVQLALGYANVSLGLYLAAVNCLGQAARRAAELSEAERHILKTLRLSCDYQTGRITLNDLHAQSQALEREAPQGFKDQHTVERLRTEFLNNPGEASKPALAELRGLYARIAGSNSPAVFKMSVRLTLLHLDGCDRTSTLRRFRMNAIPQLIHGIGDPDAIREEDARLARALEQWTVEANAAVSDAEEMDHPLLVADALLCFVQVHVYSLNDQRFFIYLQTCETIPAAASAIVPLEQRVNLALDILSYGDFVERRLGARLLLADLADLNDRCDLAKRIAAEVIDEAHAMELQGVVNRAEEHLRGDANFRQFKRIVDERAERAGLTGRAGCG
jgi:hypothetical protein